MNAQDQSSFVNALEPLAIIFKTELTELRLMIFWEDLIDLPIDAVEYACRMHRRDELKFPVPAELRTLAKAYQHEKRLRMKAQEATERDAWFAKRAAIIDPEGSGREGLPKLLAQMGAGMAMGQATPTSEARHPAYQAPEANPDARRAELKRQLQQLAGDERGVEPCVPQT
jgi:hypothetical protein